MKPYLTIIVSLFLCFTAFSQRKTRADRFFKNGDYYNAISAYQKELESSSLSKKTIQNLAISYYNTFQFRKAYRYLNYIVKGKFKGKDKNYDNNFNFKLYHVLSALGEYDKAIPHLETYQKNKKLTPKNSAKVIATIEEFKLKDDDFSIKNVDFNTESAEFGAIKKDSLVYFTSDRSPNNLLEKRYKWTHRPFLDIYKVAVDSTNKPIGEITSFSSKINSSLHEGNFCFSKDGKTVYLSKSNNERGNRKFDSIRSNAIHLYRSFKHDSLQTWSKPEKLPFNNIAYTTEHPALSPNGKHLYFSSNMPGGYGEFDLYVVAINEDNTFGKPLNLGEEINTSNREKFPFISENGDLFFSSNGHLGLGMLDVFACKNNQGTFEKPINLGAPINSSFDDFSMTFYDVTNGFFASNRSKKGDDIYNFSQVGNIFPEPIKVRFEVKDLITQNYIPNTTISLLDRDKQEIYAKTTDSISAFDINILPGRYDLTATANNYIAQSKPFLVKEKKDEVYTLYLKQKEIPVTKKEPLVLSIKEQLLKDKVGPPVKEINGKLFFNLPPIYFDFNKWNIRADSKKVLDELALKLEKYSTIDIKIRAHTDSRGTESYNQLLSEKRAESTRNYLALVGYVNARRISFEGFGESQPLINCKAKICTEDEHQTNRRSEFEITKF